MGVVAHCFEGDPDEHFAYLIAMKAGVQERLDGRRANMTSALHDLPREIDQSIELRVRHGLLGSGLPTMVLGAVALVAYGFLVNANRSIDFGRLMGVYIAVFFVVSQIINAVLVRERPEPAVLLGGALIVAGGLVIQLGGTR